MNDHQHKTVPMYSPARNIKQVFGVSPKTLRNLEKWGYVRSAKLGSSQQAGRLYKTADVLDALDRLSAGKSPRRRVRVSATKQTDDNHQGEI